MRTWFLLRRAVLSVFLLLALSSVTGSRDHPHGGPPDDSLPPDDGSGPDDEDMADLFGYAGHGDVIIRCYRCTGVLEQSGCNVTLFYENPENYVTECNGHCINISSADSTVYECTSDVPAKASACFQKGDMTMCVCTTDLCNGSPPPPRTSTPAILTTPSPTLPPSSSSSPAPLPPVQPVDDVTMELPAAGDVIIVSSDRNDDVAGSGVNVTFPEPSKHRQNNNTYIEAGNVRSGAGVGSINTWWCSSCRCYYFCSSCLSFTIVLWCWGFCWVGERGFL